MSENIIEAMASVKAKIHVNNIKFDVYKSLVNKNLAELDIINTDNRELYKELGELYKKLEG